MSLTNPFSVKTPSISTIGAAEINAAGQSIAKAVDGVGGGLSEPSPAIDIGGDGLIVSTELNVTGDANLATLSVSGGTTLGEVTIENEFVVDAGASFLGTVLFDDAVQFNDDVDVNGATTLATTTLGDTTINGELQVNDLATLAHTIVDDNLSVTGVAQFDSALVITNITCNGAFKMSGSRTRILQVQPIYNPTFWEVIPFTAGLIGLIRSTNANDEGGGATEPSEDLHLIYPVDLPHGAVVSAILMRVTADSAHTSLPAHPIKFEFLSKLWDGSSVTVHETQIDTTSPIASYEAQHTVTITVSPTVTIDKSARAYFIRVINEWGADYVPDGNYVGLPKVTYTAGESE